jgi:hypothetical protein
MEQLCRQVCVCRQDLVSSSCCLVFEFFFTWCSSSVARTERSQFRTVSPVQVVKTLKVHRPRPSHSTSAGFPHLTSVGDKRQVRGDGGTPAVVLDILSTLSHQKPDVEFVDNHGSVPFCSKVCSSESGLPTKGKGLRVLLASTDGDVAGDRLWRIWLWR